MTRLEPEAPPSREEERPRLVGWLADLSLGLLVTVLRLSLPHAPLDDAYLLLAVVRNALLGGGPHLVLGGGDAALSTLAWPGLVALPALAGVALPQALAAAGWAAEVAAALAARRVALALGVSPTAALFAAALFATQPVYLLSSLGGMETPLYCAALALAAWGAIESRGRVFALAVGLVAWTRVEGLALAALLLLLEVRRRSRAKLPASPLIAGGLLALAAPCAHRLLFGEWLPATLAAKSASGAPSLAGAGQVALEMLRAPLGMSAYWLPWPSVHALFALVAGAGLVRLFRDPELRRRAAPALLPSLAHVALFVAAGRAYAVNFPWYFAPPLVAAAALTALGASPVASWLAGRSGPRRAWLAPAVVLLCAAAAWPSLAAGLGRVSASFTAHRERLYAAAAIWLTGSGDVRSLASNEVGALAFFSPPGTAIVDLFGIARPPETRGLPWLELVDRERPEAVVSRIDFRYRRELEAARPGRYVWARFGALDLGLDPELAGRLEPRSDEMRRLYLTLDLWRAAPPAAGASAAP